MDSILLQLQVADKALGLDAVKIFEAAAIGKYEVYCGEEGIMIDVVTMSLDFEGMERVAVSLTAKRLIDAPSMSLDSYNYNASCAG